MYLRGLLSLLAGFQEEAVCHRRRGLCRRECTGVCRSWLRARTEFSADDFYKDATTVRRSSSSSSASVCTSVATAAPRMRTFATVGYLSSRMKTGRQAAIQIMPSTCCLIHTTPLFPHQVKLRSHITASRLPQPHHNVTSLHDQTHCAEVCHQRMQRQQQTNTRPHTATPTKLR